MQLFTVVVGASHMNRTLFLQVGHIGGFVLVVLLQVESKVVYILGQCSATEFIPYPWAISCDPWSWSL